MIGEMLGSYQLLRVLGEGGMGMVYLARHQVIGRLAAVKVLRPEYSAKQEMLSRIFNEARVTAAIHHPGLVDIYDFGRHSDGSAYIVMEYLEGESLSRMIAREGALPADLVIALGRQIASAVAAAHEQGIIHRDLKSDNVFLVRDDETSCGLRARLLDFGIAKLAGEISTGGLNTRTGSLIGTPAYMSPEQCRGAGRTPIDARSDLYSLGCVMFEMACGRRPFEFEGLGELIAAHLGDEPPRPRTLAPSLPAWLEAVILQCLEKNPEDRPESMEALAKMLASSGAGVRARSARKSLPPAAATMKSTPSTFNRLAGEVTGDRRAMGHVAWAATGLGVIAALVVGAVVLARPAAERTPAVTVAVPLPVALPPAPPPAVPTAPAVATTVAPAAVGSPVAAAPSALESVAVEASIGASSGAAAGEPGSTPARRHRPAARPRERIEDGALDPYGAP